MEVVRRRSRGNHVSLPDVVLLRDRVSRDESRESEEEEGSGGGEHLERETKRVDGGRRKERERGEKEVFREEGKEDVGEVKGHMRRKVLCPLMKSCRSVTEI